MNLKERLIYFWLFILIRIIQISLSHGFMYFISEEENLRSSSRSTPSSTQQITLLPRIKISLTGLLPNWNLVSLAEITGHSCYARIRITSTSSTYVMSPSSTLLVTFMNRDCSGLQTWSQISRNMFFTQVAHLPKIASTIFMLMLIVLICSASQQVTGDSAWCHIPISKFNCYLEERIYAVYAFNRR